MQRNVAYTLVFAAMVCVVCAVVVSGAAVSLKERQTANATLDKQKNVLLAAGLKEEGENLTAGEVEERFASIEMKVIDLATGEELPDVDPRTFDQQDLARDPTSSRAVERNPAQVQRVPEQALVYEKYHDDGALDMVILPVEGNGLWSTLYGFVALDADLNTVRGLTFYQHGETPGLGGEVDNPSWKALWPGREIFGPGGEPEIEVVKGRAGPPEQAPHEVDGLSGATITSRGVTHLLHFWVSANGFRPYLKRLAADQAGVQAVEEA